MPRPTPIVPAPGQESVWDYPRPPRLERTAKLLRVVFGGETIAETSRGYHVLETSHPPVYYFPPADVRAEFVREAAGTPTNCEWKGRARYFDAVVGGRRAERVAWSYPEPVPAFAPLRDYLAFYAARVDACYVNGELVTPQPGDFYGGWITVDLAGPFKGGPGSWGW